NLGDGNAQLEMARLSRLGTASRTGQPSLVDAYKWYALAARTLDGEARATAIKGRQQTRDVMSEEEYARAQAVLGMWERTAQITGVRVADPAAPRRDLVYDEADDAPATR